MKTAMLVMVLAMVAGTLQAEVAWKWDDGNRPADTVTAVEQPISGTFASTSPTVAEKSDMVSAFTFFTAFFDASVMSSPVAVDGTLVKWIFTIMDTQKAGALLENLVAEARHLLELFAVLETALFLAVLDDVGGQSRANTADV